MKSFIAGVILTLVAEGAVAVTLVVKTVNKKERGDE